MCPEVHLQVNNFQEDLGEHALDSVPLEKTLLECWSHQDLFVPECKIWGAKATPVWKRLGQSLHINREDGVKQKSKKLTKHFTKQPTVRGAKMPT